MPMPGRRMPAGGAKPQAAGKTAARLMSYVGQYRGQFCFVLLCILISAVAGVAGSLFLEVLIDDYITPLIAQENPAFGGLLRAILGMAGIYLLGILATYVYNRLMVVIAQGVLNTNPAAKYPHMQTLPIP